MVICFSFNFYFSSLPFPNMRRINTAAFAARRYTISRWYFFSIFLICLRCFRYVEGFFSFYENNLSKSFKKTASATINKKKNKFDVSCTRFFRFIFAVSSVHSASRELKKKQLWIFGYDNLSSQTHSHITVLNLWERLHALIIIKTKKCPCTDSLSLQKKNTLFSKQSIVKCSLIWQVIFSLFFSQSCVVINVQFTPRFR